MTPEVSAATAHLRHGLDELQRLERRHPGEVAHVVAMLVAHLRSWRPVDLMPMDEETR